MASWLGSLLALGLFFGPPAAGSAASLDVGTAPVETVLVASGWRLSLSGKSPLLMPRLTLAGAAWYPVKDALVYAGCTALWSSSSRMLELTPADGKTARLLLGEPYLFEDKVRVPLSAAPRLHGGTVALPEADLRIVLKRLSRIEPVWAIASEAELATVIDLYRGVVPSEPTVMPTREPEIVASTEDSRITAKVLNGAKLKSIVLDAGHGGRDPGAHGRGGLQEKDTCLDIALKTRKALAQLAPDLKVILSRDKDVYLTLRERTDVANQTDADLFVSIHNNAARNRDSKGTQVFFYDANTSDRAAADLVSRENEDVNELDVLLTDLAKSLVRDQSIGFASRVQSDLARTLKLKNRDLSFAPFYVLARTKMPAILIEVAFITNKHEERLLASDAWREKVAASIARGVVAYRKEVEAK